MDTIEIVMYVVWAVVIIIAIIVELSTAIYIGWAAFLAGGASLITHAVINKPLIEILVFGLVWLFLWIGMFILGKYVFKKRLHQKDDGYMYYIGKETTVVRPNKRVFGYIAINDKYFRFTSPDRLIEGDKVIIKEISGVTFKVKRVKKEVE